MPLPAPALILGFDLKCSLGWDGVALLPSGEHVGSFAGRGIPDGWRRQLALSDAAQLALKRPGSILVVLERPVPESRDTSGRTLEQLTQTMNMLVGWACSSLGSFRQNGRLLTPTCADVRRWAEEQGTTITCKECGGCGTKPTPDDAIKLLGTVMRCQRCEGKGQLTVPIFPWRGSAAEQDGWVKAFTAALGYDVKAKGGLGNADQRDSLLLCRFGLARLQSSPAHQPEQPRGNSI
jgi:hypothetical protein